MTDSLIVRGPAALERPSFIKANDTRGTENILTADIRPPALKLAQAMSPEVKRAEPDYIEGLREGELFNSLTQEVYGENAVNLIIVNQLGHRNMEFDPIDRKIVLDGVVPDGDPRTEFTFKEENGQKVRIKPRATKFYDYLILLLLPDREPQLMTLSLKSTQLKKATQLNTLLKLSKLASFAHRFKATPVPERRGNNSWYGWRFDLNGWPTEAEYVEAEACYDRMLYRKIIVEAEAIDETTDDCFIGF